MESSSKVKFDANHYSHSLNNKHYYYSVDIADKTIYIGSDALICRKINEMGDWRHECVKINAIFIQSGPKIKTTQKAVINPYLPATHPTIKKPENQPFYNIDSLSSDIKNNISKHDILVLINNESYAEDIEIEAIDKECFVYSNSFEYELKDNSDGSHKYFCNIIEYKDDNDGSHKIYTNAQYKRKYGTYGKYEKYGYKMNVNGNNMNNNDRNKKQKRKRKNREKEDSISLNPKKKRKMQQKQTQSVYIEPIEIHNDDDIDHDIDADDDESDDDDEDDDIVPYPKSFMPSKPISRNDGKEQIIISSDDNDEDDDDIIDDQEENDRNHNDENQQQSEYSDDEYIPNINDGNNNYIEYECDTEDGYEYDTNDDDIFDAPIRYKQHKKSNRQKTKSKVQKNKSNNNNNASTALSPTTSELNKIYKHNKIREKDNAASPALILNFVQFLCESNIEEGLGLGTTARFTDITSLRSKRDNFDWRRWPTLYPIYLNPPFSGQNPKQWSGQLIKYFTNRDQSVIFLGKVNAMGSDYVHQGIYWMATAMVNLSKHGIKFGHHVKDAGFSVNLYIFDAKKKNKNRNKRKRKKSNGKIDGFFWNLEDWKDEMDEEEYQKLTERQELHKNM